jgi:hypothetical protein
MIFGIQNKRGFMINYDISKLDFKTLFFASSQTECKYFCYVGLRIYIHDRFDNKTPIVLFSQIKTPEGKKDTIVDALGYIDKLKNDMSKFIQNICYTKTFPYNLNTKQQTYISIKNISNVEEEYKQYIKFIIYIEGELFRIKE